MNQQQKIIFYMLFSTLLLFVSVGFGIYQWREKNLLNNQLENRYQNAFHEIAQNANEFDNLFRQAAVLQESSQIAKIYAKFGKNLARQASFWRPFPKNNWLQTQHNMFPSGVYLQKT